MVLSERVLEIRGFEYDGLGPAAYWWADANSSPSDDGFILLDGPPSNGCGETPITGANGSASYRVEFPEGTSILDVLGGCKFSFVSDRVHRFLVMFLIHLISFNLSHFGLV